MSDVETETFGYDDTTDDMLTKAQKLKNRAMDIAQGGSRDEPDFWSLRKDLCDNPNLRAYIPQFLRSCRNPQEFWSYIQPKFASYKERREYIAREFERILTYLEDENDLPGDYSITATLNRVDSQHVREAWQKALNRRAKEPDGAITMARTLLESTCKYILDEVGETYTDKDDLPGLYHQAARQLSLAPNQQVEQSLKRVLGWTLPI